MSVTPDPSIEVESVVPEVVARSATTVRLHPQRSDVQTLEASKLGGPILWPQNEPWPRCIDGHPQAEQPSFVPILQLRKQDVPELPFPMGTDLFQLLWCPSTEHENHYCPIPLVFWRDSKSIDDPVSNPQPKHAENEYVPIACQLSPERVTEYPDVGTLDSAIVERLVSEKIDGIYQFELSVCPGTKVCGYPGWVQDPRDVRCEDGHKMQFLLQVTDSDYLNISTYQRWIPQKDRWIVGSRNDAAKTINNPAGFQFGHAVLYLFMCHQCRDKPVKLISQR